MRKILLFAFLLQSFEALAQNRLFPATGIEAGFSRMTYKDKSAIGPSWVYHFETQVDKLVSFFGQAGQATSAERNLRTQTIFSGGLGLDLIPLMELRLGAGLLRTNAEEEFGPLMGFSFRFQAGPFITGPVTTYLKTKNYENASLRWMLLLEL